MILGILILLLIHFWDKYDTHQINKRIIHEYTYTPCLMVYETLSNEGRKQINYEILSRLKAGGTLTQTQREIYEKHLKDKEN